MQVRQLAQLLGITNDTVRYYTRNGMLKPKKSLANGYKDYDEKEVSRMRFILSARSLGFNVDEIAMILSQTDAGESACTTVRQLIEKKLSQTEKQFWETVRLRAKLISAISDWSTQPNQLPTGNQICHLIEGTEDRKNVKNIDSLKDPKIGDELIKSIALEGINHE